MDDSEDHLVLLYNEDGPIARGDPQDLLALQETATTANDLYEALISLKYPITKLAARGTLEELEDLLCSFSPKETFIFNNCDGFNGNNLAAVEVIRLIERMGFRHTGALADSIELCIDKPRSKERLMQFGIPTPRYQVFLQAGGEFHLEFPVIVKPSVEDASLGIDLGSVVCDLDSLYARVGYILETYREPALVEEFIAGRELEVSMWGNKTIQCLPISEQDFSLIASPLEQFLTYDSKWVAGSFYFENIPARVPAQLTPKEEKIVRKAAEESFRAMGLRDLGRVDIRFKDGIPYVIDVNEIPDLSPDAGFWNCARAAGLTYPQMAERILLTALTREGRRHSFGRGLSRQPVVSHLRARYPRLQPESSGVQG
ncbi:MAG: ATP-grasp domain-containing protein [Anaerolineales bacterium]|jgi:D-alanine-D-alanine ligase